MGLCFGGGWGRQQVGDEVDVFWDDGELYKATIIAIYKDGKILVSVPAVYHTFTHSVFFAGYRPN